MITDTVLRVEAMQCLTRNFGEVDAERFITLIKTDDFDYTEWQKNLWADKTIDEIFQMAVQQETENAAR